MEVKGREIRRLHIIYFLSRMGRVEHPHLIRVHHLSPNGVYLRDVKRWLGKLRGKDMPAAFSWSYKRRYRAGFVWQDLLDDDLITPISDNEYVLKGSQIIPTKFETKSLEKKTSILGEKKLPHVEAEDGKQQKQQASLKEESQIQIDPDSKTDTPTKISSEISQDSPVFSSDRSTSADGNNSFSIEEEMLWGTSKENPDTESHGKVENYSLPSLYHHLLNDSKKQNDKEKMNESATPESSFSTPTSSSSSQSSFTKGKSYSPKVSGVLRNLVTCGGMDTNDAVLVLLNKASKTGLKKSAASKSGNEDEICRVDSLGHSSRSFGTSWNYQPQQQHGAKKNFDGEKETHKNKKKLGRFMNQTPHKPFGGPTCSQCGKSFKPEKMHKHMKSCRGMKSKPAANSAEKTELQKSTTSSYTDSTSDYLLTN